MPGHEQIGPFQVEQSCHLSFLWVHQHLQAIEIVSIPYPHTVVQGNADNFCLISHLFLSQPVRLQAVQSDDRICVAVFSLNRFYSSYDSIHINGFIGDSKHLSPADKGLINPFVVLFHFLHTLVRAELDAVEATLLIRGNQHVVHPHYLGEEAFPGVGILDGQLFWEGFKSIDVLIIATANNQMLLRNINNGFDG